MAVAYCNSPFGPFRITSSSAGITGVAFTPTLGVTDDNQPQFIDHCILQLEEYFDLRRKVFDLPLDFGDAPQFHREVWRMLLAIPYGKTRSYSTVAEAIGRPGASRAVGQAVGRNPLALIVPCHRVIGKRGGLRGYAYGLDIKRRLLHFENPLHCAPQRELFKQSAEVA